MNIVRQLVALLTISNNIYVNKFSLISPYIDLGIEFLQFCLFKYFMGYKKYWMTVGSVTEFPLG